MRVLLEHGTYLKCLSFFRYEKIQNFKETEPIYTKSLHHMY